MSDWNKTINKLMEKGKKAPTVIVHKGLNEEYNREKTLTPAQVCLCGSVDFEELSMDLQEDGMVIVATYECNQCCGCWECHFKFGGVYAA